MTEDSDREHERDADEARLAADEAVRTAEEEARQSITDIEHLKEDMETGEGRNETLRQMGLIYSGLIGVAILMVQPFLGAASLDLAATISVIAFAVAVPLLAALVLLNRQESYRQRRSPSVTVLVAHSVAQGAAVVGLVAGFWHIDWVAGVCFLVAAFVGIGVHSAGFTRLELLRRTAAEAPSNLMR